MKQYFKDPAVQQQYDRNGYVVIDGMLEPSQIQELKQLFKSIEPPGLSKMYCNIYDRSHEENEHIAKTLYNAYSKKFNEHFINCSMNSGVFLAKGNGPDTASILHQDWNSVDEENFESLTIWTPLDDVDETNGCIYAVDGSHRIFNVLRSITIPTLYLDFDAELEPFLTPIPMKGGQTLVFAHNLFHGSKPKLSGNVRAAAVIGIMPDDARTIYYYNDQEKNPGVIELFETSRDFYLNGISKYLDRHRPDDLPKVGEIHREKFTVSREEFFETLRKLQPSTN